MEAHPPKKPGFLPNLGARTRLFVKNPVSMHPCDRELTY